MPDDELPLFAAAKARELGEEPPIVLAPMTLGEHVVSDYQLTRLSLKEHPMALLRPVFDAEGVTPCEKLRAMKGGERVKVAGAVLIRQRPGKGTAVFITLEDEGGIANVVLWSSQLDKFRRAVMASRLMLVDGVIQRSKEGVIHVMADRIVDRTEVLGALSDMHGAETPLSPADELTHTPQAYGYRESRSPTARHPRNVRLLPPSRDFR
jgi:error-prone DNA polymerase